MNHTAGPDFRSLLQNELLRRCQKNPGYSLRSFARALQISPSSLSRILKGERTLAPKSRAKIATRLGLDPAEVSELAPGTLARGEVLQFQALGADAFAAISDWYHYAILELTHIQGFRSEPRWVAKRLGITVSEVNAAVERLVRLGMLKVSEGQWIHDSGNHTNVTADQRAAGFRKLQRQILEQALKALDETPIERRDQGSMTMAINTKRLPEAIEMLTRFRREMCALLEQDVQRDDVYQLSVSLFPINSQSLIQKDNEEENV